MICIADDLEEGKKCAEIAEKYDQSTSPGYDGPSIFCTIGVHPHHAKDWKSGDVERLKTLLLSSKKVVALGEIGLDYHYDNSPRDVQRSVLEEQLLIAKELDLPVVVHNRDSIEDMMQIIERTQPTKAVLHCCTEKWSDVQAWIDRGYMLSFTGIATYPRAEEIRETIRQCPLEQMMIETDAPYLAPVPHRGQRNEPAFVVEVAKLIAELKNLPLEQVADQTVTNTMEFFGLPA